MLEVLIIRHGIAEDEHPLHPGDDRQRRLTPEGEQQALGVGAQLVRMGMAPELVLHSPWARTTRTAQLLCEGIASAGGTQLTPQVGAWLAPGFAVADVESGLWNGRELPRRVALVGHQPMVSQLVGAWIGRGGVRMYFERAAVAHLLVHRGKERVLGELVWTAPPEVLLVNSAV